MEVNIRRLSPDVSFPEFKTSGACAFDIAVCESGRIEPGERKPFRTGLVVAVPEGHVLLLFPRSSNAKKGLPLGNCVGVIDRDYCGPDDELIVYFHNIGQEAYEVKKGEYLAQGLILQAPTVTFVEPNTWQKETSRGGFGTTS